MNTLVEIIIWLLVIVVVNWLLYTLVRNVVKIVVDIAVDKTTQYYKDQINILIGRLEEKNKE